MSFQVKSSRNSGIDNNISHSWLLSVLRAVVVIFVFTATVPALQAQRAVPHPERKSHANPAAAAQANLPDSLYIGAPAPAGTETEVIESSVCSAGDSLQVVPVDTVPVLTAGEEYALAADSIAPFPKGKADEWEPLDKEFSPDPTRAVWFSALFPGLGQVYNRRYWKLPIIVGGYLGLGYATSWNNQMLRDYSRAYADLLDNDPSSKSYMDFFAPNVDESSIDKNWLTSLMRSRKNFFRRNRDLCIISMVGVYLLAMVDAYVDASLSHFDITPKLSMDVVPALMQDGRQRYPSLGLAWALNF